MHGWLRDDLSRLADDAFRRVVRRWLEATCPAGLRFARRRVGWAEIRPWYMALAAKGWLCPGWPREHGGMGLSAERQLIMAEECARLGVARLPDDGIATVGPLLIRHGTPDQRAFFLPRIQSGEHVWCVGSGDPKAGPDRAGPRAEPVCEVDPACAAGAWSDHWAVSGRSWTAGVGAANWIVLPVRTGGAAEPRARVSFALLPLDTPGIAIDRHDAFCTVSFEAARVPKRWMVGASDAGTTWDEALTCLDRIAPAAPARAMLALARLRQLAEQVGAWGDPVFRDRFTRLRMDLADLKALYMRCFNQLRAGEAPGPQASMLKVIEAALQQRVTEAMLAISGGHAALLDPAQGDGGPDEAGPNEAGPVRQDWTGPIDAGGNDVRRRMIAREVLGLAASRGRSDAAGRERG